jgi:hypothetical protein
MKSPLMIKDLEIKKELTRQDLCAVRGGFAQGFMGGNQTVGGGSLVNVNVPVQTVFDLNFGAIAASPGALQQQF